MKDALDLKVSKYMAESGIGNLIDGCAGVVVGFSGGADSALLTVLMKKHLREKKLVAFHLNHMIRDKEADRDNDFARSFCLERGIEFEEERADILSIAEKEKFGTEECARNIRYELFDKCRKKLATQLGVPPEKVLCATAHNADDNLETVVFNLSRGSGVRGIGGISPVRDGVYIRPLLCLASDEIREYCKENGIAYVIDSSNETDDYTRNVIRHSVVPVLKRINPSVASSVLGTSRSAREDDEFIEKEAEKLVSAFGAEIPRTELISVGRAVSSRVLKILFKKVSDDDISRVNTDDTLRLVFEGKSGRIDLPGAAAYVGETLCIKSGRHEEKKGSSDFSLLLKDGVNKVPHTPFIIRFDKNGGEIAEGKCNVYRMLNIVCINNDKIKGKLYIRNRQNSDVYFIRGHHRKVKKLMCDAKIPPAVRDMIPLVCDDDGIVWIPGFAPKDGYLCKDKSKPHVYISCVEDETSVKQI